MKMSTRLPRLARWLVQRRQNDRYATTQENAWALHGLLALHVIILHVGRPVLPVRRQGRVAHQGGLSLDIAADGRAQEG